MRSELGLSMDLLRPQAPPPFIDLKVEQVVCCFRPFYLFYLDAAVAAAAVVVEQATKTLHFWPFTFVNSYNTHYMRRPDMLTRRWDRVAHSARSSGAAEWLVGQPFSGATARNSSAMINDFGPMVGPMWMEMRTTRSNDRSVLDEAHATIFIQTIYMGIG